MNEIKNLIDIATASFSSVDVDDARPAKYFAKPPYTAHPAHDKRPDGFWYVANATGFNCLTFASTPGAVFTDKETALKIADKWNNT